MVKIKICGLKRALDIEYVNELKPDYIGFVFADSKRRVSEDIALELTKNLRKDIKTVGVFVNEDINRVKEISEKVKLDILQFHGDEDMTYINSFTGYQVWKSFSIRGEGDLENLSKYTKVSFLLDSKIEGIRGGSGRTFNWNILKDFNLQNKIILAGGLSIENITEAIKVVRPFAVDVSSGVESQGVKDYKKIKDFIGKVRSFI
ncbi:MAG: phosphoribosylanthranilate isomerase [Clostridiales bacterium]|jgi:phosphoribosylanthranilate isomerase|uniref:N-(5'-phosphoribosyl)anthranilate isomerase n=1 Tax=Clostridium isatidis TaxID=182773 RepID=A0A343JFJ2_9CLOT|nr:phosphoribosylanthranilate isomerase [Clostridium isatidis]ASW44300.1 N-(5'-phosphoribosyl)anthranilate isomerase [Clostridium isatidis]NLL31604.1 phosphoribosylanthranilate isomerase [Clostridiales bacterium]NLZ49315.1 phosphoribosylanthranilate isomerase [Clostridiales bacterium]